MKGIGLLILVICALFLLLYLNPTFPIEKYLIETKEKPVKLTEASVYFMVLKTICPKDYCTDWVKGSCLDGKVYLERQCIKYPKNATTFEECEKWKEIFYERKIERC